MGFILVTNLLKLGLNGTGTFVLVFQLNLEFINKIRILPKKTKKKKTKEEEAKKTNSLQNTKTWFTCTIWDI